MSIRYLISLLGFYTAILSGQPLYEIDPRIPVHPLDSVLEVLSDTAGTLSFNEAINSTRCWVPLTDIRQTYGPSIKGYHLPLGPAAYFVRTRVRSSGPLTGWQLHLEDRLFDNVAWIRGNGLVEMHWYPDATYAGKPIQRALTGADAPPGQRDVANYRTKDRLNFDLPVDSSLFVLLRIEGNAFGFPPYLNANLRAPAYHDYHPFLPWRSAFNSFMLGAALIMLVTHLLLFFYLRERVYAWFSLWLLLCMLVQGMTIGVDLRDWLPFYHQDFRFLVWLVIPNSMIFGFWLFGRAFVRSYERYPFLDRFMLGLPLSMFVFGIFQAFRVVLVDPYRPFTALNGHYEIILLFSLAGIALGVILASRPNDVLSRYFGVGAVVASIFTLLGALWSLRLIRLPADPYSVGILVQFIIYSFGMAYRRQQISLLGYRKEIAAQRARAEVTRLQDLNDIKARFLANVSHEFRTPLTLIKAPLESAGERQQYPNSPGESGILLSGREFDLIRRNVSRLRQLVEQLLELSRLEIETVHLHVQRGDLIAFLRRLLSNYESLAERAGIGFVLNFPKACLSAYFDADKLTKIVGNLVDNAIKYTPARGTVNVSVKCTESRLIVIIKDTGSGISSGEIEHIFDRFYRVAKTETEGSGIGLALVKELVDVYQGSISVSSTLGKGSTFRINLPHSPPDLPSSFIVRENNESTPAFSPDTDILVSLPATHDKRSGIEEQPLILIVEDHADLRQLLVDLLTVNYRVLTAKDGHHGERMAIEHLPELIISDVMMPGQDGYALCNSLKSNPKTSHIPLILLTARAGRQDTIAGLTQGADDYLTKPFDGKELLLRVKNLLLTRRRLWEYFQSKDLTLLPGGIDERSLDDQFIQTLAGTIIDHLANDALNVDMLARAVGFSQSQLTRKLRALTNKTPNQLITEMRLHEAHRQLELKSGSVSEIAYLVGYTSPSYFTRRFQQHFGYPPSSVKVASPDE